MLIEGKIIVNELKIVVPWFLCKQEAEKCSDCNISSSCKTSFEDSVYIDYSTHIKHYYSCFACLYSFSVNTKNVYKFNC